jgi:hypothetical protein
LMSTFTRWLSLKEADVPIGLELNGHGPLFAFARLSLSLIVPIGPRVTRSDGRRGVDE